MIPIRYLNPSPQIINYIAIEVFFELLFQKDVKKRLLADPNSRSRFD